MLKQEIETQKQKLQKQNGFLEILFHIKKQEQK